MFSVKNNMSICWGIKHWRIMLFNLHTTIRSKTDVCMCVRACIYICVCVCVNVFSKILFMWNNFPLYNSNGDYSSCKGYMSITCRSSCFPGHSWNCIEYMQFLGLLVESTDTFLNTGCSRSLSSKTLPSTSTAIFAIKIKWNALTYENRLKTKKKINLFTLHYTF